MTVGDHALLATVERSQQRARAKATETPLRSSPAQFDLSRPRVRREIKLIDTLLRTTSELELDQARVRLSEVEQQLQDARIAHHRDSAPRPPEGVWR